jgi:hypothetical protein
LLDVLPQVMRAIRAEMRSHRALGFVRRHPGCRYPR